MSYFRLAATIFYFVVIFEKAKSLKCYKCEENVDGHCVLKNASSFVKCEDFYTPIYYRRGVSNLVCFEIKILLKLRPADDDDNSDDDNDNKEESEKDIELKSCTEFKKAENIIDKLKDYSESHDNEPLCIKLDNLNSPYGTFDDSFDKFMLKHYNGDETIERSMVKEISGEICYCISNFCNVKYIDEDGSSGENLSSEKSTKSGTAISVSGAQITGGSNGNTEKVNSSSEMSEGVKSAETVSNRSGKVFKSVTMGTIFGFIFVFYLISM